MKTMKAVVFRGRDRIEVEEVPKPTPRAGEAVIRITTTTICGTDVHIVRGEYPVRPGLVLGHEPVGVVDELGPGLDGLYSVGQRVIVGAITPCGQCFYCLNGVHSQCGGGLGGWRFGNTINGAWAEYVLVPDARANLAPIPAGLADEEVLLCPDVFSTGLAGAESGSIRVGDAVAVFAQGPIGLCATVGAKLKGASLIIGIDSNNERLAAARRLGANVTLNPADGDPVAEIKRLTDGRVAWTWPSRRLDARRRSRTRCGPSGRGGPCRASASTRANWLRPTTRSTQVWAIRRSSRRSVRAARSGCAA
jgi:alcohol dehydrogenase